MTLRIGALRSLIALVAIASVFSAPAVVAAHAEVVKATPAAGSTVPEPVSEVVVTYSEDLTDDSRLGIRDESGTRIAVGTVDPANRRRMVATLEPAVATGTITVNSQAISTDRHIERTRWTFTVAVPASPTPASQSSAPAPSEPRTTPEPTAAPSPAASPAPGSDATSDTDVILPIVAALAIITIGAGFLLSRGRRGPSA